MNRTDKQWEYAEKNVPKSCDTCEFNFGKQCAGHADRLDNGENTYGMSMEDAKIMFPNGCSSYGISFDAFNDAVLKMPR